MKPTNLAPRTGPGERTSLSDTHKRAVEHRLWYVSLAVLFNSAGACATNVLSYLWEKPLALHSGSARRNCLQALIADASSNLRYEYNDFSTNQQYFYQVFFGK
jgi:hypothetical protein